MKRTIELFIQRDVRTVRGDGTLSGIKIEVDQFYFTPEEARDVIRIFQEQLDRLGLAIIESDNATQMRP